jgi:glycosyltransferase involved in cell wall biosynthesis
VKVMVLGIRGIPGVQGGVETHAEHLYERLAAMGCQIEAIVRTPFVPPTAQSFGSIRLRRIWSPKKSGLEALVHSILGVLYAGIARPDILHIHAVGPAITTPLARLFGLRVVVTHHGPDYDRDKWNAFARFVLRAGEACGMRFANARIVISKVIADLVRARYGCESVRIPNGVTPATVRTGIVALNKFGLSSGKYFLQVSRLVPEKRQLDLIQAYSMLQSPMWKLVLVGGIDSSEYAAAVRYAADRVKDVVLTDFQRGEALAELYSHAGTFVLPSSHEGLPIAMLEALSYGLPVVASDIPANTEVGLEAKCYFPVGNQKALAESLRRFENELDSDAAKLARRQFVEANYDWHVIAKETLQVYESLLPHLPSLQAAP